MVDHRKREKIPISDGVYVLLLMKRGKDNDGVKSEHDYPTIYRHIVRDYDKDVEHLKTIAKSRKGVWRIYRSVNKRSFAKANTLFKHRLIDDYGEYYYRLDSLWKTCLLKKESRAEKKFLIDIDNKKDYEKVLKEITKHKIKILEEPKETVNGYHIITTPFDKRIMDKFKSVEIGTDHYVFVSIIGDKK